MRAVDVAPLKIVDRQNQWRSVRKPREQLSQPGEGPPPQLLLVGHLFRRRPPPRLRDRLHALQHGKRTRQETHVRRQQTLRLVLGKTLQVPRKRIDQAVERLVRNRLSLIAPPREHHGVFTIQQLVQERANERGLPGSRPAEDEQRHRLPAVQRGEPAVQAPADVAIAR